MQIRQLSILLFTHHVRSSDYFHVTCASRVSYSLVSQQLLGVEASAFRIAELFIRIAFLHSHSGYESYAKSRSFLQEIAETKLPDLNAVTVEAAMNVVAGTAKNMGITIEEPSAASS